jgi:hypothetical protein
MTVLASAVTTKVRNLLVDNGTSPRWTDAELLNHISDAQRTICAFSEDEIAKVAVMQLVAGTRQQIPADGISLLNIVRNMGTTGTVPGRAIRIIQRDIIDNQNPTWHSDAQVGYTYNYIYDPLDSKNFFVYPPSNGKGYIEINYSFVPPEVASLSTALVIPDVYQTAVMDYVMFRCHQKDADSSGGHAAAQMYLQMFQLFLKGFSDTETEVNPNVQMAPFNPGSQGTAR